MYVPPKDAVAQGRPVDTNLVPESFDDHYVQYALKPFLLSGIYRGERPVLPMIDFAFSKERALPAHLLGMLYESWVPNVEEEGTTVFLQGYQKRGPNNERKKIYYSALTPDLYEMYAEKIERFLDQLFDDRNAGEPLMKKYYEGYFDMYWNLHLGVTKDDIPDEIKEIGRCFINVLGYWFPTRQDVHDNYMRVRELRCTLQRWIEDRVKDMVEDKTENPEKTFVHYWLKNGEEGPNFGRKDIIFECFHNFLAFSQWGHTLYRVMEKLNEVNGDPDVREWCDKTMSAPNETDGSSFTRLDRFVMELFRTISPNEGSVSSLPAIAQFFGSGYTDYNTIITPHPDTSRATYHWDNPNDFDPDRYKAAPTSDENNTAPTSDENDETKCKEIGLARCPFSKQSFPVKDGRKAELTNSGFGAVYPEIDGKPHPVCDDAGYAPFGFGYRRCAGEFLTVGFVKDLLIKVRDEKIKFGRVDAEAAELAVAPAMVVKDNICFKKEQ
jgi:hypothetical protein